MKYPSSIYLIVATEFCARFAFCGMRTLLSLYLRNVLLFPETISTVVYHVFIMVCFTIPFLGAITADGCLGRFQTILQFSFICTTGHILAFLAATPPIGMNTAVWTMIGLTLVAVGAGGVKPCVAAFGGDQFRLPQQQHLLQPFFSLFYFTANLGGLMGMLSTPLLRKAVSCFEDESCYSLGFGLPAILAVAATVLFSLGKPLYRIKAPKENIMGTFLCCATYAIFMKIRHGKYDSRHHWLDYADQKYDAHLIRDMKAVLAIFLLFVPLPVFWSLLVQQGSRWTFQATRMDGHIMGVEILPDQVQAVSPAVVLLLIPLFNRIVYPTSAKCNVLVSPLDRMAGGGLMAGLAFVCAGTLEYKLQQTYPPLPPHNEGQIMLINTLSCDLQIEPSQGEPRSLPNSQMLTIANLEVVNFTTTEFIVSSPEKCGNELRGQHAKQAEVEVGAGETKTILVGVDNSGALETYTLAVEDLKKPLSGRPKIRLIFIRGENLVSSSVSLYDEKGLAHFYYVGTKPFGVSNYTELHSGRYTYYVTFSDSMDEEFQGFLDLKSGGVYSLILREHDNKIVFAQNFAMTPPNHISILWLFPQYVLISIAEVLFAISGLEFCFTQAPKSMKTVTMAAWYFTVACGNLLVIVITQAHIFRSQANEFFLFMAILLLDMTLFKWICSRYRSQVPEIEESSSSFFDADDTYPLLGLPSQQVIHS